MLLPRTHVRQLLFRQYCPSIHRHLVWLDSAIPRMAWHLRGISRLAGELRPWIDSSFSRVRSSLGNPCFQCGDRSPRPGLFPYFIGQYSGRRRRCWASGLATAGNRCLALVCQYRGSVRWSLAPISGPKNFFASSCAGNQSVGSMTKKRVAQSAVESFLFASIRVHSRI